jgi:DNA-binding response OmpR family regulator
MRILVVEDEQRLAEMIQTRLTAEGHAVDVALTGEDALHWVRIADYDALVLDVMLPGVDGIQVARQIRAWGTQVPILLLTARDAVEDRVAGLDAGADDYMVKPFAVAELLARLRALARRPAETLQPVLTVADLRLDPAEHRVWRGDDEHTLTNKEFRILELLMRHPDHAITRRMISEYVWDYDFLPSAPNVIDVHIRSLRSKLDDPYEPKRIETVRGVGYRLSSADG